MKRALEIVLAVGIVVLLAVIGLRAWTLWRAPAITPPTDYRTPGLSGVTMTIPGRPHDIPAFLQDPQSIQRRVSFSLSTNSLGLRGPEFSVAKPPGRFRVVAVGECVTFGNGVEYEQAWPWLLQERLRARFPGRDIEVINAGATEAPADLGHLLINQALGWSPDLIIFSPGTGTVFLEEHVDAARAQVWLSEERYGQERRKLRAVLDSVRRAARARGVRLAMVTPPINSFFLPDGMVWVDEERAFAAEEGVPLVDATALFRQREARDGLTLETRDGVQRLVRHHDGVPETLLQVPWDDPRWHVAPQVYAWLDAHPDVSPLLSIDDDHPNPRGHALLAQVIFDTLEAAGLWRPLE